MTIAALLPRFREARRALEPLAAREGWTRAQIEDYQLQRINESWQVATQQVPHYRRLAATRRMPARFSSLDEFRATVPVLHKQTVREQPHAFLATSHPRGSWCRTSGSTGATTAVFWSHEAVCTVLRSKYRFYQSWGVDIFDPMVMLWGDGLRALPPFQRYPARLRQRLEDRLRHRLRLGTHNLGRESLRAHLRRLARFEPAAIYASSTAAYLLALEAQATGFTCDSLKVVFLSAEPASRRIVQTVQATFGVPAIVEYGSVECGFIAGEGPDRRLRVREDLVLLETRPREAGGFDVVVTVLTNPAFPLLRYAIGDVTDAPLDTEGCGFAALGRVDGRQNDLLVSRSGAPLHGSAVTLLFEPETAVRRYQVRQGVDGAISVAVELTDPAACLETARLARHLGALLEGLPVTVKVVEQDYFAAAPKHRWIVSDLAASRQEARPS